MIDLDQALYGIECRSIILIGTAIDCIITPPNFPFYSRMYPCHFDRSDKEPAY